MLKKILKTSRLRALTLPDDLPDGKQKFGIFEPQQLTFFTARPARLLGLGTSIVLLGAGLLVPLPHAPSSPLGMALHDSLHFPLFALITLLSYALVRQLRGFGRPLALGLAVLAACTLGGVSELVQARFGRTASWQDFRFDLLGCAVATAGIFVSWRHGEAGFRRWLAGLALLGFAAAAVVARPAWLAYQAEDWLEAAFPQLGDFEADWESLLWRPQGHGGDRPTTAERSDEFPSRGNSSLRVEAHGATWAGVRLELDNLHPWTGKNSLDFDVFNPADPFELGLRIDVPGHARFYAAVPVASGQNSCRLLFSELRGGGGTLADLPDIKVHTIILHLGQSPANRRFYLDNVRLE